MRRFRGNEARRPLIALLVATVVALLVLKLGGLVSGGWGGALDRRLLIAARGLVPDKVAIDLTALGSGTLLTLFVAVTAGGMLAAHAWRHALLLVAAAVSGSWTVGLLKDVFARARPALVEHLVVVGSPSFPSAHAANSALVLLTAASLAARLEGARAVRRYLLAVAVLATLAIGTSRVVLGVHWPSDVLAGWAYGGAWALAWWALAERLAPRERAA